ncbi:putative DNA modification/repair radical SAM protein [Hymenobacter qilianensis]|uniref:DNA modification/repair radical SAM protein n=2 Tax=Hymenobacter qilianensis TaxID=1385715 RepID=A0ACB5PTF5_9BACT|nr:MULTISPECIES: putative DNA modification/repair radical SAM protein [Hymenobacter]MBC6607046.1 putative DNA modification/repair radical SAM protein [Hymenobacter sp. BT188]QNP52746.1 putative DNA modification/repair radical SAM protein [Hymenobacter qilianensis]GGF70293.1 putative DNA modification/repair radical SAM protein [Hymenobacter qilianensis]
MNERIQEKLSILADAAKYDVSCSSSGGKRKNENKGLGNAEGMGICHSYTEDGRCVSLLKILLTNYCIFDCAYCVSRRSNDVKRAAFTVDEVVDLTMNFYRRNYIEGLFLSSGIFKDSDYTMERLVRIVKKLRTEHKFNGYIHVKTIPGASPELIAEAGLYADRLSVNIELPSELSLQNLAPEKNYKEILTPMKQIHQGIVQNKEEKALFKKVPAFAAAGQSTQLIVGASDENDHQILQLSDSLYKGYGLKRVYYSGYVPVTDDARLPQLTRPPVIREHRLYQSDWLIRFYGFQADEILDPQHPHLDLEIDPKLAWALRNRHVFPVDVQTADYEMILRVPGVGARSAKRIVAARRFAPLTLDHLHKFGVVLKRAKFFLTCRGQALDSREYDEQSLRRQILFGSGAVRSALVTQQLDLFAQAS